MVVVVFVVVVVGVVVGVDVGVVVACVSQGGDGAGRGGPLVRTTSPLLTTFPIFYAICMRNQRIITSMKCGWRLSYRGGRGGGRDRRVYVDVRDRERGHANFEARVTKNFQLHFELGDACSPLLEDNSINLGNISYICSPLLKHNSINLSNISNIFAVV